MLFGSFLIWAPSDPPYPQNWAFSTPKMVNFGGVKWSILDPRIPKKYPPNLKNGPRGAKFPFSECQNYTDKSISQIPPGPPNRGSKPPGGGGHPHPPATPSCQKNRRIWGGTARGGLSV